MGCRWHAAAALLMVYVFVAMADTGLAPAGEAPVGHPTRKSDGISYHHVWPPMEFGWRIVLCSLIGFFAATFGSIGAVGGGGIFVPMLTLIIGFDPKSSTAVSKCMIMGAAVSTVYCNLKLKHPTLDMPLIDYDLALLIQPLLMLGISIGVILNVIFPEWLITVILIIVLLVTSTKAFLRGVDTWKKETITRREVEKRMEQICQEPEYATTIPTGQGDAADARNASYEATSVLKNVYWKEFGLLVFVWTAFLVLQITKNYTASCSMLYWVLNSIQIPVSVGMSMYEAHGLLTGKRVLSLKGSQPRQLYIYCLFGIIAGLAGGLLGLGGAYIMAPLFMELGIPPQVASATATFAMMFSSSLSVVEYYLLHRFPVPYAAYFTTVAFIAPLISQHGARRVINWLGRVSLIIFILASMIFISALSLGGVGVSNIVRKMERHKNMGFEDLCKYGV